MTKTYDTKAESKKFESRDIVVTRAMIHDILVFYNTYSDEDWSERSTLLMPSLIEFVLRLSD